MATATESDAAIGISCPAAVLTYMHTTTATTGTTEGTTATRATITTTATVTTTTNATGRQKAS